MFSGIKLEVSHLLLLQSGYSYVPFASLESVIEDNKDLYYSALRKTQKTLKQNKANWEPWIIFFLQSLKKQKDNLNTKIQCEKLLLQTMPQLSIAILNLLREHGRLTISETHTLTGANKNTIKSRLRELTQNGQIKMNGQARASWYTLA